MDMRWKCAYQTFEDLAYLKSLDSPEKNRNISCLENVIFVDYFAVKVDGSDVNRGSCIITPRGFTIPKRRKILSFTDLLSSQIICELTRVFIHAWRSGCIYHHSLPPIKKNEQYPEKWPVARKTKCRWKQHLDINRYRIFWFACCA